MLIFTFITIVHTVSVMRSVFHFLQSHLKTESSDKALTYGMIGRVFGSQLDKRCKIYYSFHVTCNGNSGPFKFDIWIHCTHSALLSMGDQEENKIFFISQLGDSLEVCFFPHFKLLLNSLLKQYNSFFFSPSLILQSESSVIKWRKLRSVWLILSCGSDLGPATHPFVDNSSQGIEGLCSMLRNSKKAHIYTSQWNGWNICFLYLILIIFWKKLSFNKKNNFLTLLYLYFT